MTTDHDGHAPAIAAITRVLTRSHDDGADAEVTARHILTALIGHGWRLTNARPARPGGGPAVPPTAEFLAARAAIQPLEKTHSEHRCADVAEPAP